MQSAWAAKSVQGLPGKNIKLRDHDRSNTLPAPRNEAARTSPLGITIKTHFQRSYTEPPPQLFPRPSSSPTTSSPQVAGKKRKVIPKSLKLGKEISPRDGEIPIGLALGPSFTTGLAAHRNVAPSSGNPAIVITPVEHGFGLSSPLPTRHQLLGSRVASSVYSTYSAKPSAQRSVKYNRSRSSSAATLFEEDDQPPTAEERSMPQSIAQRISMDSVLPTPRRSVGWWNLITSPLLQRSNTKSSKRSDERSTSDENDSSPLIDKGEPGDRGARRDIATLDRAGHTGRTKDPCPGPFKDHKIPTTGEAANYFDPSCDFSTPCITAGESVGSNRTPPSGSLRSTSPLMSPLDPDESILAAGREAPLRDSSKKVPEPVLPSQTPPKSSRAAVVQDFDPSRNGAQRAPSIKSTPSTRELTSTSAPSPVVAFASVRHLLPVRRNEPATFKPEQDSNLNEEAPPPPPPSKTYRDGVTAMPSVLPKGFINVPPTEFSSDPPPEQPQSLYSEPPTSMARFRDALGSGKSPPELSTKSNHLRSPFETPAVKQTEKAPMGNILDQSKSIPPERRFDRREKTDQSGKNRRTCQWWSTADLLLLAIGIVLFAVVILSIILSMTLVNNPRSAPVQSEWLNLTGFPPIPTGVSTVAAPKLNSEVSTCVSTDVWSCAVPKDQQSVAPNSGPYPNFRFSILFNNATISNSSLTQPANESSSVQILSNVAAARSLVRRDSSPGFPSTPAPPSKANQVFLGNTTDNVTVPLNGEETPFIISFLPLTVPSISHLTTRSLNLSSPTLLSKIPNADITTNNIAAPALLYPLPQSQSLRLYNRGLNSEHYGFYNYFSKSIYLSLASNGSSSTISSTSIPSASTTTPNANGGAPLEEANTVCTFSQTRFLVQIWTRTDSSLLSPGSGYKLNNTTTNAGSAFDFARPGSFPWPVSITLDRHGGNAAEKGVYCHGMDGGRVLQAEKALVAEDRGVGGSLINAAVAPFTEGGAEGGYGGTDGGTGGCSCSFGNWE